MSDFRHQRVVGIGISQHRTDGQQYFGDGQGWRPLVSQYIEAYASVAVYVRVVDPRREVHFGRLEGIVGREVDR